MWLTTAAARPRDEASIDPPLELEPDRALSAGTPAPPTVASPALAGVFDPPAEPAEGDEGVPRESDEFAAFPVDGRACGTVVVD
jgi:hypothetical protein